MANTRSNLVAASIYEVSSKEPYEKKGGGQVSCMFNPFEYSITKANSFSEKPGNQRDTPQSEFFKAGAQTLQLNLFFDTYEAGTDVSQVTNQLWKFMLTKTQESSRQNEKIEPPMVAFEWGVFCFVAYITSMTQKFTLFLGDGTPVRANVEVTFTQYKDVNDYPKQNPTSGGGDIQRIWRVIEQDRLDAIAYKVYGDATLWRRIADYNDLPDPLKLRAGQVLVIPLLD